MLDPQQSSRLQQQFPGFREPQLRDALATRGLFARLDAGQTICRQGDSCAHLALLTAGSARVFKLGETGREITLYRVAAGECCILTASCILSDRAFPAQALAERTTEGVLVPVPLVTAWMETYADWRRFIWQMMADRLGDVISLVEEVAFRRMDRRIVEYLLERSDAAGALRVTHQDIAAELGTSREVVSRILKDLEQRRHIVLARGLVSIADRGRLATLSV